MLNKFTFSRSFRVYNGRENLGIFVGKKQIRKLSNFIKSLLATLVVSVVVVGAVRSRKRTKR